MSAISSSGTVVRFGVAPPRYTWKKYCDGASCISLGTWNVTLTLALVAPVLLTTIRLDGAPNTSWSLASLYPNTTRYATLVLGGRKPAAPVITALPDSHGGTPALRG